jgi:hypothetical protein
LKEKYFETTSQTKKKYIQKRKNNELQKLFNRPDILAFIKNKRLKCFEHARRADGQLIKKILGRKIKQEP